MDRERRVHLSILAGLILCHLLVNNFILSQSSLLRVRSDAAMTEQAVRYARTMMETGGGFLKSVETATVTYLHPQLYPFALGIAVALTAPATPQDLNRAIQIVNSVFFIILLLSVYGIGCLLYGRQEGLLAAVLLSFCPMIFGPMRLALIEVPLAALVSLTAYLLLKSDCFGSRGFSLAAGTAFGSALLTKETALIFIFPLFLFCGMRARSPAEGRRRRLQNAAFSAAAAIAVSAPVYLNPASRIMFQQLWLHAAGTTPQGKDPFFYLSSLHRLYLGIPAALAAIPLLASYLFNIRRRAVFLTLWLIAPIIIFSCSGFKHARYLIPALPALFLIVSQEAFTPFFRRGRQFWSTATTLIFCFQYGALNFFPSCHPLGSPSYNVDTTGLIALHRNKYLPALEGLVNDTAQRIPSGASVSFIVLPLFPLYHSLPYFFNLRGITASVMTLQSKSTVPIPTMAQWRRKCAKANYLIGLVSGSRDDPLWLDKPPACTPQEYKEFVTVCLSFFEPMREIPLDNVRRLEVYKRR